MTLFTDLKEQSDASRNYNVNEKTRCVIGSVKEVLGVKERKYRL